MISENAGLAAGACDQQRSIRSAYSLGAESGTSGRAPRCETATATFTW